MGLVGMFDSYAKEKGFGPRIFHIPNVGFSTYHLSKDECYIEDIYVVPEKRKEHHATYMANEIAKIAKESGINILTGSVSMEANGQDKSRAVLLAYGFKLVEKNEIIEWYAKEI